jgi:glycosyltransferase involved in cell wall biosynthesis
VSKNKKKILVLSDHALSTSGVGCQTRHLLNGLIEKGDWTFRQFGAALKHTNYDTVVVNEDLIIKPIDGFGSPDLIRVALATEKPDAIFLFTDPRFFIWLFEMEDEIHQMCPIVWWHVWDNRPTPTFNYSLYESTDLINCHSYLTYEMCSENFKDKTNFVPHAIPENLFFPIPEKSVKENKASILGANRQDHFVGIWVNRNAKRKRPGDILLSWKAFLDNLDKEFGHRNASLIMHTEPLDPEGPNLYMIAESLGIHDNILFSRDRLEFEKMNILYNISDFCINCSYAEGFGLSTLEAMQAGTPIIAVKTGGLTRQVVDHRDGTENGVAIDVETRTMVGSQQVPYIYEDYTSPETISEAIMTLYKKTDDEKLALSEKVRAYTQSEFSLNNTVDLWDKTLNDCIDNWKDTYSRWECSSI